VLHIINLYFYFREEKEKGKIENAASNIEDLLINFLPIFQVNYDIETWIMRLQITLLLQYIDCIKS
jgi:hypothetical protein